LLTFDVVAFYLVAPFDVVSIPVVGPIADVDHMGFVTRISFLLLLLLLLINCCSLCY
jgi:hypothetical protein